jgi:hypothetical protein
VLAVVVVVIISKITFLDFDHHARADADARAVLALGTKP